MSICRSIFPEHSIAPPDEIRFRAVCALGWAIDQNFADFFQITNQQRSRWAMCGWVDLLERKVLDELHADAEDCNEFPQRLAELLENLSRDFTVRKRPGATRFLLEVASQITNPCALDPMQHLQALHNRGFELASRMIADLEWSAQVAATLWEPSKKSNVDCVLRHDTETFVPETTGYGILLKVCSRFEFDNALLKYLILEFQFMHEYISHVLPVWRSSKARMEEELLVVAANGYYATLDRTVYRPQLVNAYDKQLQDPHRKGRDAFREIQTAISASHFSRLALELATTAEDVLTRAEKNQLLTLFTRKMPPFNREYSRMAQVPSVADLWQSLSLTKRAT